MQQRGNVQLVFLMSSSSAIQVKRKKMLLEGGSNYLVGSSVHVSRSLDIRFFVLGSKNGDAVSQIM
jgi:Uri superfamily endonuclease